MGVRWRSGSAKTRWPPTKRLTLICWIGARRFAARPSECCICPSDEEEAQQASRANGGAAHRHGSSLNVGQTKMLFSRDQELKRRIETAVAKQRKPGLSLP